MSEMIERVADVLVATRDQSKLLQARAAIAAMREPTEAMCTQGHSDVVRWRAMIDEALR